jgi:SAM-dependent methyltransferase
MGYFDWHGEPGYFGDLTRHFDPRAALLDVGCGTGWLSRHFQDYTGVDGSPEAVAIAQAEGRNVLLADLSDRLPFDDGRFEAAVLKDVIEHLDDPARVVEEVHRVLRPGARVFASCPDAQRWVWDDYTHRRPFTRKALRLLFTDHGFRVERSGYESVMPGTGVVSGLTRRRRRPRLLAVVAWLPLARRNTWLLARRDG